MAILSLSALSLGAMCLDKAFIHRTLLVSIGATEGL